ncbi:MAG: hypothetical protein J6B54_03385 [Clostridia bacterium]|nr:hypothetical protein [Clostridia bacterium]
MPRKEALISQAVAHLVLDLACFFLLAGNFSSVAQTSVLAGAGYLIFLILSYGLRPFFGVILDEIPRTHSQAVGCLLVGLACFLPPSLGWVALFPAGVGSALFHTGAIGESLAFARGYFSRNAVIVSTGVFGAALGTVLAQKTALSGWIFSLLLCVLALVCFFFAEARKYPRRIRSFRHSVTLILPDWGILSLTLIPLLVISLVGTLLPADWAEGPMILIPAAACMLGRGTGGIAADRFGPRKTALVCFAAALVLLTVFPHVPWLYCLGLSALCAPTSICFGTATAALSRRPHLAVGACSAVILLGTVPALFHIPLTVSVRCLCGGLLILALAVSVGLYTDHCRLFHLTAKIGKRKGDRV